MADERKIVMMTSMGKKFRGVVDIPNSSLRTTDLFNSASIFWKDPDEKCFDNAVLMRNVQLILDETSVCSRYDKLQIRLSEVVYFHDDLEAISDDNEKMRAKTMIQKGKDQAQKITIITTEVSSSFYTISGTFFGLFKKKSNDMFIPLTDVAITEIYRKGGKWFQRRIELPHNFICISTSHIEAMRMECC